MVIASGLKDGFRRGLRMGWVKRSLQAAVLVATAASVSETFGGGTHIQVNNVAAGTATFTQAGSVTTVRTGTNSTIINYQQLSIGAGDTLNFIQPTVHSRVLNRIEGNTPSQIDGSITSNGAVFLLNPNGVVFGHGAVITANQFVAAAGHMSDADFLGGVNHFTGVTGPVTNYGTINAQQVNLVGLTVGNFGEIIAGTGGIVTMTSGSDVYLATVDRPGQSPHILVKVSQNKTTTNAGTGVTNGGTITSGTINLGAGDLYAAGIYNSGTLKGAQITLNSGANTNITTGTVDASSATGKGGTVQLLGKDVAVESGTVNASGKTGGGTILVGGDLHGAGNVATSDRTFVGTDATLTADATTSGKGGEVVVWSNQVTRFYGHIGASGGSVSGTGGYVEVSSKDALEFTGTVNTGTSGTLLLDPSFIDVNSAGTANFTNTNQVDDFADADVGSGKIDPATLAAVTTGNVLLESTGDIQFTSALTMGTSGVGVIAKAGGNIAVNATITTKGGIISLSAGDQTPGAGGGANPGLAAGNISIGAGKSLDTTSGSAAGAAITLRADSFTLNATSSLKGGTGGAVSFYSNIATHDIALGLATSSNITLTAADLLNVTSASKIVIGESGNQSGTIDAKQLTLTSGIPLELNSDSGTGTVILDNGGVAGTSAVSIGATTALTIRAGSGGIQAAQTPDGHSEFTAGPVTLTSSGDIGNATNPLHAATTAGTVTATSTGGNVTLAGLAGLTTGNVSGGNVTLTAAGNLGTGNLTATSGAISLTTTASGNVNATGNLSAGTSITINANGAIGNTTALSLSPTTTLSLTSGGLLNVTINSAFSTSNLTLSAGGTTTIAVAGTLTVDADVGASTNDILISTTTGSGGNITSTTGRIIGKNLTLSADGGINALTNTNGTTLSVTTAGVGGLGNVTISDNKATTGPTVTVATDSSAQTINISESSIAIKNTFGDSSDSLVLTATTGAITGNNTVTLTNKDVSLSAATTIGTSGTPVKVDITGNLSLTTTSGDANVVLPTTTTLHTANLTLSMGGAANVTVGTLVVDANVGTTLEDISFTTTTGGITGGSLISGADITLVSKTGIGTSVASPLNVNTTGTLALTSQGAGSAGNIFIADTAALTLTAGALPTTAAGSAQTVSLASTNAGGVEVTGNLALGNDSLILSGSTVTIDAGKVVSAANVTLVGDTIAITGNVTGTNGVTLAPLTNNEAITITNTEAGFVTAASLANVTVTSGTLTIGGNTTTVGSNTGLITIGAGTAIDLSSSTYNLQLVAPGGVTFVNSITLASGKSLTFTAPGAITGSGTTDVIIGGAGSIVFTGITGNIGSSGTPLETQVANLGGVTGAGGIFLDNTGALTINGAITLTGSTGSFIETHSPLTVSSAVSMAGDFSLIAGDNGAATGDDLTVSANVGSSTNGCVTLQAGDNISLTSGTISGGTVVLAADHESNGDGSISQTGGTISAGTALTASAATGISLTQANTIPSASLTNTTSGAILLTTGGALQITTLSQTGGGAITLSAGGDVTQTAAISASGSNLSVTTTGATSNVTLGLSNNIGTGNVTLVAVGGNVSYTSSATVNVQKITTTGNVSLSGTAISQVTTDTTGIHGSLLTVTSDGAVTLTNGNNSFSSLSETDSSSGSTLAFTTNSASGLNITTLAQVLGGTANVTNTGGNISSSSFLDIQNLNLTAKGGISLSNTSNIIQSLSATNTVSGDINVVAQGGGLFGLTVTGISNTGGGATILSDVDGVALNGTIAAGSGLTVTVGSLNGVFSTSSTTVVSTTGGGAIAITADNMNIDSSSTTTTTGNVVLTAFTPATTITLNGTDGSGVLGLTSTEIGTISAANIIIGSTSQTGVINNNAGTFNLPTNVTLITQGSVSLDGMTITSASGAELTVNHGTTMTLGTATLSGGLVETGVSGSGAGGNVTLHNGTVTIGTGSVTFNSNVQLSGSASLTTNTTGTSFTFQAINGTLGDGTESLTITAGTGTVTFNGGVGTTTALGSIQVISSSAINLGGNIVTNGGFVGLTSSGALTLTGGNRSIDTTNAGGNVLGNNIQLAANVTGGANSLTLTAGALNGNVSVQGFTSTGNFTASGKQFTNSGVISANVISITNARPATINGNLTATGNLTIDGSASAFSTLTDASSTLSGLNVRILQSGLISIGGPIVSSGNVTLTSSAGAISATGNVSGAGTIAYSASTTVTTGNITDTTGAFTSTGTDFTNNGNISAVGISITNTGIDTISGNLAAGSGNLSVTGATSITDTASPLSGGNVTLTDSGVISIGGNITSGANVTLTSSGSSISATGNVSGAGTIAYSASTTVTTGNITDTSGPFTSSGTDFTNNGNISAVGISITNTGIDTISGNLAAGSGNLSVTGATSITDTASPLSGGNVTLTDSGTISIGGNITSLANVTLTSSGSSISATGNVSGAGTIAYSALTTVATGNITDTSGPFTSSGTDFTNNGNISAVGISITNTGVDTISGNLAAGTGNLSVTGASSITDTASPLTGANVTLTDSGVISIGGNITSLGDVTLTSSGSSISATGNVSGAGTIAYSALTTVATGNITDTTGPFTSSGTTFTSNGNISAVGVTITNTGVDTFNGTVAAGTGNLSVTGASSISDTASALSGKNVALSASGLVSVGGNITSLGNISVTSTAGSVSTTGNVSGAGTIAYSGATGVGVGNVTDTTGAFTSNGGAFASTGNISAVGITITNTGLDTIGGTLVAGTGNLSITGGTGITDSSDMSGANVTLSASGLVSTSGNIVAVTNVSVTSTGLNIQTTGNVSGAGTITYAAATTVTVGNVTSTGGLFSSSGTAFTNNGNVTAVGITITNTGVDTINGNLAAGTGALSVTGASSISDASSALSGARVTLSAGGAVSVGSTITSTGIVSVTSTGSTISITGNVSGAGTTTFSAASTDTLGNVLTTVGSVTIGGSQATLNGNVTASAGSVSVNAPTVLGANITVTSATAGTVTFGNTITGSGKTLTISANTVNLDGNVGASGSALTSLTITATGTTPTTNFASTATGVFAETQTYGSAVTVNANFLFSGGTFTFSGSLNPTAATSLTIAGDNTGTLSIAGPTIGTTLVPFSSVTVTDVTAASITGSLVSTGNVSVDHAGTHVPVTLTGSITSTAGTVFLPGNVILGVGANAITATAPGGVIGITLGNVTGATTGNLTLTSNSSGNATGVTISVGSIGSSGGRVGDIDFKSAAVTLLGGNIFAHAITFEDNVAGSPGVNPTAVPTTATIVYVGGGSLASGLILNTSGAFTMEQNQKLTVYDSTVTTAANITSATGSVTIDSSAGGGLITIADISAMGKITVNAGALANQIHIINRPGAKVLQSNGTLTTNADNGTELVSAVRGANQGFSFTGTVSVVQPAGLSGPSSFVTLASGNVQQDLTNDLTLQIDVGTKALNLIRISPQVSPIAAITPGDFVLTAVPNTVLSLQAQGQPQNIASVVGTVIPQDVATLTPERGQTISGALRDALNELGIYARDLRTDEIIAYLVGRALYDDVPYKLDPDPTDNKIATNRLPYSPVLPMVESYEKLFFKFEKGPDGKTKKVPQDKAISNAIGLAWVSYSAQMKDKATGAHFRGYLEANVKANPKLATALDDINQLRDLLVQIKNLGLTDNEFNVAQSALLKRVRPANIKEADFLAAIMGPSTLTHGQTAMR